MTREEEIRQAANACFDDIECYFSFITGAEWADDNPPQGVINLNKVWHDASEHPTEVGAILYRTTLESFELVVHGKSSEDMWKVFVKDYGVVQWAYVLDLLPERDGV